MPLTSDLCLAKAAAIGAKASDIAARLGGPAPKLTQVVQKRAVWVPRKPVPPGP